MRQRYLAWAVLVAVLLVGTRDASFASTETPVTLRQATTIAKNFVAFNAAAHFPEWQKATRFTVRKVFSTDGVVVSYEVAIKSDEDEQLGFVVVAAQRGNGEVVTAFTSDGPSVSSNLERHFAEVIQPALADAALKPTEKTLIGTTTGAYALGVKFPRRSSVLRDVPTQDGYYLFSANPGVTALSFTYKDRQDSKRQPPSSAELQEESELRKALLTGDFSSPLFQEVRSGEIEEFRKGTASISGTFSSFYQEKRAWSKGGLTKGVCHAGCAPVAWAILLEYWDRNNYPKLISTDRDNSNTSTTDADVRWSIDELRGALKTTCTSDYSGSTSYSNIPKGISYAQSRGYSSSSASNTSILWSGWWDLLSAVDSKKPPIAILDTDGNKAMDHAAVVYSYEDNWGTSNDKYCFRTGWDSPKYLCYVSQNRLYGLTKVTVK